MIAALLLAASAAATPNAVAPPALAEAAHAIEVGRLDQARLMIARAVGSGSSGVAVDRLIADLAFASGKYDEALKDYQVFVAHGDRSAGVCENGAIAALKVGRSSDARPLAACAIASAAATWRGWNACGVAADLAQDWDTADRCYAKARQLAGGRAVAMNNQGWSRLMRGDWAAALPDFEAAARADPKSRRIANNLELARAVLAADLPSRQVGESDRAWAERLNDAGVGAELLGDKKRAIAAFTQALDMSDRWYARAAANLELAARP